MNAARERVMLGSVATRAEGPGAGKEVSEWSEFVAAVPVDAVSQAVTGCPPCLCPYQ